ncbi:MAG: VirB8/TrbF family protein [bacterium]|nr:VirB8/TrbF family protein [bacterium]MDY2830864.1 VirB8/TrbF family protein [Alphaproteobacteria bacterium]
MALFSAVFRYKDKKSPDKLGVFPEKFPVEAFPERRYLWTSRALVILTAFSFCLTIVLVSTLYLLLPLKRANPMLYKTNPYFFTFDRVRPLREDVRFKEMLTEKYLTDYVQMRHSIPRSTADLFYRWDRSSLFYWYSASSVYYRFVSNIDRNQLKRFIRLGMKRTVEIDDMTHLSDNLWRIQLRTLTSTRDMPEPNVIYWRVYARVRYEELEGYEDIEKTDREKEAYLANPFGFKVTQYSVSYAGSPRKSYTAMEAAKRVIENMEDLIW